MNLETLLWMEMMCLDQILVNGYAVSLTEDEPNGTIEFDNILFDDQY